MYLLYPFWLKLKTTVDYNSEGLKSVESVSVVYLSQNGGQFSCEKIQFLIDELDDFVKSELIVIDDASSNEIVAKLKSIKNDKLRLVTKDISMGVAHSMNLAVSLSIYQNIVFCDQRQKLEKGIIKKLIKPLKFMEVGAVSSCISSLDKSDRFSFLRAHENMLKKQESRLGNLMGVYGPLFAIKKQYYSEIPSSIILDDLYLTLCILRHKDVVFENTCEIYDNSIDQLYNYTRIKRYLFGFYQIVREKQLLSELTRHQRYMLFWHKYLRIPIPMIIVFSYFYLGIQSMENLSVFFFYLGISILFFLLPLNIKLFKQFRTLTRTVFYYTVASIELSFRTLILNQKLNGK